MSPSLSPITQVLSQFYNVQDYVRCREGIFNAPILSKCNVSCYWWHHKCFFAVSLAGTNRSMVKGSPTLLVFTDSWLLCFPFPPQGVALDTSNMPREPPPPYPLYQQSQHGLDQGRQCQQQQQQTQQQQQSRQPISPLQGIPLDFNTGQVGTPRAAFDWVCLQTESCTQKHTQTRQCLWSHKELVWEISFGILNLFTNIY